MRGRGCGCPRAREQGGQRSPAARRPGAASARCQTHPPPRGAFHASRRGAVACRARSPPSEAPELLARLWRVRKFRRRPVAAPAFVPGGKPARRARVGLRREKKRGKGKGGRGEGKSGRRPRAPGEGPLGSQPCDKRPSVQACLSVPWARDPTRRANSHASGHRRDFDLGSLAPCDPSRRVTSRVSSPPETPGGLPT